MTNEANTDVRSTVTSTETGNSMGATLDTLNLAAFMLSELAADCAAHQVGILLSHREITRQLVTELKDSLATIEEELLLRHESDRQAQRESDERPRLVKQ